MINVLIRLLLATEKKRNFRRMIMGKLNSSIRVTAFVFGLITLSLNFTACSSSSSDSDSSSTTIADDPGFKLTASIASLGALNLNPRTHSRFLVDPTSALDTSLTPPVYKIAIVDFWFTNEDGEDVSIINPDEDNPTYTEDNPLIVNFTADGGSKELISASTFTAGTYTGWKMQMLYIEMKLDVAFHLPSYANETDYTDASSIVDQELTRNFRLYFNSHGKYWKRDFVTELDEGSGEWYWLRRGMENNTNYDNFFISVNDHDHPAGGSGSESTIDLFNDEDFWGAEADYSTTTSPIIVGTHSDAGGLNASMEESFTIPEEITAFYNMDISFDVYETMNFTEDGTAPTGVTFTDNVLDLGASDGDDVYGDGGLHPFLPIITVTVTEGTEDAASDAEPAYSVPDECQTNEWFEAKTCYDNYCGSSSDDFCDNFVDESTS